MTNSDKSQSDVGFTWAQNPASTAEEVMKEFSEEASLYEENVTKWNFSVPQDSTKILEQFVAKDAKILEAACGTGLPDQHHYDAGYTHLYGCDLTQEMLDIAQKKNIHKDLKQANLTETLPYGDNEFDAVTCLAALTYIPDVEATLREFCRITQKGGHVIFSHRNDLYRDWKIEDLCKKLEQEGLWTKQHQSDWNLYLSAHEAYQDKIKVGYFVFQVAN